MPKALVLKVREIAMEKITEPTGVIRLEIDPGEVSSLAENIHEIGLLQPINVRFVGEGFEIVDGHRRFLAFQLLGRKKIPCIVGDFSDVASAVARAAANLRRVDLSPIEEAAVYADLHDNHSLSYDKIGKILGVSGGVVKRRLDLLKMPPELQKAIHQKLISYGVGEELWRISDHSKMIYYLGFAVDHGVTVAVARGWVKDWKDEKRREVSDVGESRGDRSPLESRPIYLPCDLCSGPMELGSEKTIRACPGCFESIRKAITSVPE
ncbi:Nucleoid occlusion protein [subsurface metagenome]